MEEAPYNSPSHHFGKATLHSYRKAKQKCVTPSGLQTPRRRATTPLPPHLAALLSHRVDRYRKVHGKGPRSPLANGATSRLRLSSLGCAAHGREELFQDSYLSSVLDPGEDPMESSRKFDTRELWKTILRVHRQASQLSDVVTSRAEKVRNAMRTEQSDNSRIGSDYGGTSTLATLLSDLRIAAEQRCLLDGQLSSTFQQLGGPADVSLLRAPSNTASPRKTLQATAGSAGWLTAVDVENIRTAEAKTHSSVVEKLEREISKLEVKLELYQKQIRAMEEERRCNHVSEAGDTRNAVPRQPETVDHGMSTNSRLAEEREALAKKLSRSERQVEEGRELIRGLRETIAIAVEERDAALHGSSRAGNSPASPLATHALPDSRSSEPVDTPTPRGLQGTAEISELERALAIASDVLGGVDDDSQPKRLSFSPAGDSASSPPQPRQTEEVNGVLSGEYHQVLSEVQRLAAREQLHNSIIEARRSGATSPGQIRLTDTTPADVEHAWRDLDAQVVRSAHEYTRESDGGLDHTKIQVAATESFISMGGTRERTILNEQTEHQGSSDQHHRVEDTMPVALRGLGAQYIPLRESTVSWALRSLAELSGLSTPATRKQHHRSAVLIF